MTSVMPHNQHESPASRIGKETLVSGGAALPALR